MRGILGTNISNLKLFYMAQNFVQEGDSLDHVAAATIVSGTPFKLGSMVVVPMGDALTGQSVAVFTGGVWDLPKVAGTAWAQGDKLYWDDTAKNFTKTSSSNTAAGYAAAPALSAATVGRVLLKQIG